MLNAQCGGHFSVTQARSTCTILSIIPNYPPLPTVFLLHPSSVLVVNIAILWNLTGLRQKWSQRLMAIDARSALRQSVLHVGDPDVIFWSSEAVFCLLTSCVPFYFLRGKILLLHSCCRWLFALNSTGCTLLPVASESSIHAMFSCTVCAQTKSRKGLDYFYVFMCADRSSALVFYSWAEVRELLDSHRLHLF